MSWGGKQALLVMPTDFDPPTGLVRDWVGSAPTRVPPLARTRAALVTAELVDHARRFGWGPYGTAPVVSWRAPRTVDRSEDAVPELGTDWSDRSVLVLGNPNTGASNSARRAKPCGPNSTSLCPRPTRPRRRHRSHAGTLTGWVPLSLVDTFGSCVDVQAFARRRGGTP